MEKRRRKKRKVEAHQTQVLLYLSWITERRECVKIGQLIDREERHSCG
jgi:hypothetical protein